MVKKKISLLLSVIFILASIPHSFVFSAIAKSKAEGVDRTAAAKAAQWSGLVIGVNEGAHQFIITEAPRLDKIYSYAQRTVSVSENTEIIKTSQAVSFADISIGEKITVRGSYNTKTRIITASRLVVGSAATPSKTTPAAKIAAQDVDSATKFKRNLQKGARGADVTALQKILVAKNFLAMPAGVAYGFFGVKTKTALVRYQKSVGLPAFGYFGPATRAKIQ